MTSGVADMDVPAWEKEIGIEEYLTDVGGCGGRIKDRPEDFVVEEEGPAGKAEVAVLFGKKARQKVDGEGTYTWFVVEKRMWNTVDVARVIGRITGKKVYFAGNKDRRAVTAQWMCIEGNWRDVKDVSIKDVAIHSPVRTDERLRMGMLTGNWFTVVIRRCGEIPEVNRFINYFGHQRFGSGRFVSHVVGKHIVQGDWEGALHEYLTRSSPWEPETTKNARARYEKEGDPQEALEYFPKYLKIERFLLAQVAAGRTAEQAFRRLHRRVLSLFIHAYQSYIFNRIASRAVREGVTGKALVPGYRERPGEGDMGRIEREVLEEEEADLAAFRRFKKLGAAGERRNVIEKVQHLRVKESTLRFFLPKGCYATAFLREVMKPTSPEGFVYYPGEGDGNSTL